MGIERDSVQGVLLDIISAICIQKCLEVELENLEKEDNSLYEKIIISFTNNKKFNKEVCESFFADFFVHQKDNICNEIKDTINYAIPDLTESVSMQDIWDNIQDDKYMWLNKAIIQRYIRDHYTIEEDRKG